MHMPASGCGLIVGEDRDRRPVAVRLFRPEPTSVTLVGQTSTAQLLLFRALALGASAIVVTSAPKTWERFGERATGQPDRVVVFSAEQKVNAFGSAWRPALILYDLGHVGPATPPRLGPWQTQLTLLTRLGHEGLEDIHACDILMLQRLSIAEAGLASSALRLDERTSKTLQTMSDDIVALAGEGARQLLALTFTEAELRFIAPPTR